jgi:hypothetical protein
MHMNYRAIALSACLLATGCTDAWGPLCVAFCTDSTHVQRGYTEDRDVCRQLAELKAQNMAPDADPNAPASAADKAARAKLVSHFSDCMNSSAWAVPGSEDKKKDAAVAPPGNASGPTPPPPASPAVLEAQRKRAADCAFARQSADISIVAKKRAEACDLECKQQLDLAPGAPKPPACP